MNKQTSENWNPEGTQKDFEQELASENISQLLNPKPTEKEIYDQKQEQILEDIFQ